MSDEETTQAEAAIALSRVGATFKATSDTIVEGMRRLAGNASAAAVQAGKLTDEAVKKALSGAAVPSAYHGKTRSMKEVDVDMSVLLLPLISTASVWTAAGEVVVFRKDGPEEMKAFFLFVRALVLRGKGVKVIGLRDLLSEDEEMDSLWTRRCLAIRGAVSTFYRNAFSDAERYRLEWIMRQWLDEGRSLILIGDGDMTQDAQWWSPSFRTFLKSRVVETIG